MTYKSLVETGDIRGYLESEGGRRLLYSVAKGLSKDIGIGEEEALRMVLDKWTGGDSDKLPEGLKKYSFWRSPEQAFIPETNI